MSRFVLLALPPALLLLSATASLAQIYPLTNGPNGTGDNTPDSARGFIGSNAVAPERELLYHPERAGNAAALYGAEAAPAGAYAGGYAGAYAGGYAGDEPLPVHRRARRHHRRAAFP